MKIVLTRDEVEAILLERINRDFVAGFNTVSFDGYGTFTEATIEDVPVQPKAFVQAPLNVEVAS